MGQFYEDCEETSEFIRFTKKSSVIELVWTFTTNILQSYSTENTVFSIIATNNLILLREIIDVYCVNYTKLKYIMWRNAEVCMFMLQQAI